MDYPPGQPPPPPPRSSPPAPLKAQAARPQVIHVVARPSGLWRAVSIVGGLMLFAIVFVVGFVFGIVSFAAASGVDGAIVSSLYRSGGSQTVAVIPVRGIIDSSQAGFVHQAVKRVLDDSSIKAVVLRVDSPGGGVTSSDQIWYEVKRMKDAGLPVVASFGGVAASGGYYISCGADAIVAEETCITGSIGVIAQVLTFEGLLNKVGIEPITLVATGSPEKSVANDLFRTWTDRDKQLVQTMLDAAHDTFRNRVRDGRMKTLGDVDRVASLADGTVFTAQQAKENGLIDSIGYLDDAIAHVESIAGLATGSSTVITLYEAPSLLDELAGVKRAASQPILDASLIRSVVNDLSAPRAMYLMR